MTASESVGNFNLLLGGIVRTKAAIAGFFILGVLAAMTIYALIAVPLESFSQWNDPGFWIDYPKSAAPSWVNSFLPESNLPNHIILGPGDAKTQNSSFGGIPINSFLFDLDFDYNSFPTDFIIDYCLKYGDIPPVIQVDVTRPDGESLMIYNSPLPASTVSESTSNLNEYCSRIFSTDESIKDNLRTYTSLFDYSPDLSSPQKTIFSQLDEEMVLRGNYQFNITYYLFDTKDSVEDTKVILGGKVYGLMGTDDLRRDLSIGIFWGAPVALFVGLTAAISSVTIGMLYGLLAGYKGGRYDEALMRVNDLVISLPTFVFLIILSITIGSSIYLITMFLVIFGWAGIARVARSLALQIKNLQYVEASKLMGERDIIIILRHILPQLLPLTFASIALAVPAAILAEATLSFIGLGDPSIPTWGSILHDANTASAAARGLWWWILPPGIMIAAAGISFALIGSAIESVTNPRGSGSRSKMRIT
ncbi:MAG TPA: ABC transporter permease [Nitrososphaeraceae archaeon]|nr:ABC transporter permease [Nitrososphaeraceae archaeon]